jgi:D-tyrosyl-tRNA(Tyr) deacylase
VRAVVQRSLAARVEVSGEITGAIARGLVVFLGVAAGDEPRDLDYLVNKVASLRVFEAPSAKGKMTLAVAEAGGAILLVSQFTLLGDLRAGNRPSFTGAMEPARASELVDQFAAKLRERGLEVATGRFGADMRVFVENDGPVTILLDSRKAF